MSTPLLSSPPAVVVRILEVAEAGPEDVVYDLGCGDGRILIAAVECFNAKEAVGYEIREDVYLKALQDVARRHLSKRIRVINDDLFRADLSKASVITFYLDSFADEKLKAKLERETSPGTRIVSHDFSMPGWRPTVECSFEENGNFHMIYVYAVPESFSNQFHPTETLTAVRVIWETKAAYCV